MQWFKLMADLQGHPKRWRFEELAETEYGLHYLTAWFSYICKFAPDGDISKFTKREVARACEWKGDPETLWAALQGAGFIDQTETGFVAHDWEEHNGRFLKENAKRKEPKGYPRVTQGLPTLQDNTIQDIQDKTEQKDKPLSADAERTASVEAGIKKQCADVRDYWHHQFEAIFKRKAAFIPAKWLSDAERSLVQQLGPTELKRRVDNNLRDGYITNPTYINFLKSNEDYATLRQKRVQGPKGEYESKRGRQEEVPDYMKHMVKQLPNGGR